jgi:YidC/Oxa1 family membrane protein insertase
MDSRLRVIIIAIAIAGLAYMLFFRKGDEHHGAAMHDPPLPTSVAREPQHTVPIHADGLDAVVTTYSGALEHLEAPEAQFRDLATGHPLPISTTWQEYALPLRSKITFVRNGQNVLPPYLTFNLVSNTPTSVELVARPPGTDLEIHRTIRAHSRYAFDVDTRVVNHGAPGQLAHSQAVFHFVRRSEEESKFFRQSWQRSEALCRHDHQLLREWRDDLAKKGEMGARDAEFVALGNLYFVSALAVQGSDHPDCIVRTDDTGNDANGNATGALMRGLLVWRPEPLDRDGTRDYHVVAYFGPKYSQALTAASPSLHEAVNLGFFALIARGLLKLLQFLHSLVRNWGVAIILLTVIVRTALYPLLARSTKSMAMMQKLKPELDVINAKYADNAEQRGLATMELYRKHKVNPVAGCVPQLAQLPIWWALYTTLQTSVELFHARFVFWLHDLSAPDPYYVLPLVLGGMMFLQQKIMPASMPDPVLQKMMTYFMPIFLTGISLFLPAGLALYMTVNSVLAMVQQRITKAQIDRMVKAPGGPGGGIEVRVTTEEREPPKKEGGTSGKNGGRRGGRR